MRREESLNLTLGCMSVPVVRARAGAGAGVGGGVDTRRWLKDNRQ